MSFRMICGMVLKLPSSVLTMEYGTSPEFLPASVSELFLVVVLPKCFILNRNIYSEKLLQNNFGSGRSGRSGRSSHGGGSYCTKYVIRQVP